VTLEEARDVLHDRLVTLDWEPPARRYGRVFVGTPHQARGRSFRVVFVPGWPSASCRSGRARIRCCSTRAPRDRSALVGQDERGSAERLAVEDRDRRRSERLYLSYPRLDVSETRARVPSFYAPRRVRAITGRVPDHRGWPSEAPKRAARAWRGRRRRIGIRAIDDLEHDLATLKPLLDARDPSTVKGHAHYLLG
jgi:hypothetical protein